MGDVERADALCCQCGRWIDGEGLAQLRFSPGEPARHMQRRRTSLRKDMYRKVDICAVNASGSQWLQTGVTAFHKYKEILQRIGRPQGKDLDREVYRAQKSISCMS